jgi:hypothetical protein
MHSRFLRAGLLWLGVVGLGVLACDLSTFGLGQASKPKVTIQSPVSGAQFREGDEVAVQSIAVDSSGIIRVELAVDGALVRADAPPIPQGQTSFTLVQKWKATAGTHTLSVRAYNSAGGASEPVFISVNVTAAVAGLPTVPALSATPTLLPIGTLPTVPPTGATASSASVQPSATRPRPSPTLSAPPGVYATSIRVEPAAPKRNQPVAFFVTFLNTTGAPQDYRWRIRIYPPDVKNAKGDTAPLNHTLAVGTSEIPSSDNWTIRGPGGCEDYFARVFWIEPISKQETEFIKPDASGGPAAGFQICP